MQSEYGMLEQWNKEKLMNFFFHSSNYPFFQLNTDYKASAIGNINNELLRTHVNL